MTFLKMVKVAFLLLTLGLNLCPASPRPQKYAPIVGRWRIELSIKGNHLALEFETDGEGEYGYGTGYFVLPANDSASRQYPAAWSNRDPQKIGITGEIVLPDKPGQQRTLVLRVRLSPGEEVKGEAVVIDERQVIDKGTFVMKRLLGPEEILKKR